MNKQKSGARWNTVVQRSNSLHDRPGVLDNQKITPRVPRKLTEVQQESERLNRLNAAREREPVRKQQTTTAQHPLGIRLLEEGVVIAAGLSLFVKSGIGQIAGWIRDGKELVHRASSQADAWDADAGTTPEMPEEEIWDDEIETHPGLRMIGRPASTTSREADAEETPPPVSPNRQTPLRYEVEQNKVQKLQAEEEGLPDDELFDQAGALRARISDSLRSG